ncbi:MAG: RdgB/HAM1 family non-canonical purine NTP pyrophosphatase [Clostridiales Family XIII bacterium]|nr:RdgB/HAM1 family non-canonical purine NTP pyrophosphatase [Clostridiales Family XIII bacterium]
MEKLIVLATTNTHKIREIGTIAGLFGFRLVSRSDAGVPDDFEIEETGTTFEENSLIKAEAIYRVTGGMVIADDSGLAVDALGGRPGLMSARFAVPGEDEGDFVRGEQDASDVRSRQDKANNAKLLRLLEGVPGEERTAKYVAVITMLVPGEAPTVCRGEVRGSIGYSVTGENGFGYDPIFIPEGFDRPFGLIPAEVKNKISHRYEALQKLQAELRRL